jgi:outer membrane protein assembly factor BamB
MTPAGAEAGQVVLSYQLELGFDPAGRTGAVIVDTETKDRQLAVTLPCRQPGCTSFSPLNQDIIAMVGLTVRTTTIPLTEGLHDLAMTIAYDDGSLEHFVVQFLAASASPSPDLAEQIRTLTGPPANVQTVFGVGNFAYFITSAFGSIWVAGKASRTVTRLDAASGEVLATFPVSDPANRITATNTAVYVSGKSVTRINPTDNTATTIEIPEFSLAVIGHGDQVWATGFQGGFERIDPDATVTKLNVSRGAWMDLAFSNGLVWAVSQSRETGRVIAFDGETGKVRYNIPVVRGEPHSAPVRLVADEQSVVVGVDTSDLGGRTGELVVIDPSTGLITNRVPLSSRPEGVALTARHIWTSGAVLDRDTLAVSPQPLGFSVARADDGSIWGTGVIPSSGTVEGLARRFAPGDFAG